MVTAWIDEGVGLVLKERGPSLSGSVTDARDAEHRLKAAWRQVGSQLIGAIDSRVGTPAAIVLVRSDLRQTKKRLCYHENTVVF